MRRCPEIQAVVIRQLGGERVRERMGRTNSQWKKGGGVSASRRNASLFLFVQPTDAPQPAQRVECSGLLWALLLCRAAEGLTEPVRQREKED